MFWGYHLPTRIVDDHLASALLLLDSLCWLHIHPVAAGAGVGPEVAAAAVVVPAVGAGAGVGPAGPAAEAGHFPSL